MQKSLENYLEAADGTSNALVHAKLLIKLTHIYQKIAPAYLGQASRLANYKSGTIVIHAASGAVASKLKQLAPTLANGFCKSGVECNVVQVKVKAYENIKQSSTSTVKPLSRKTSTDIESLRDTLPDSPLRGALDALLKRSAKSE